MRWHEPTIAYVEFRTAEGLFKTEFIGSRGPGKNLDAVGFATLKWVDWFNHRRLLEPLGYTPPVQLEEEYYRQAAEEEEQALRTAESPMNPRRFKPQPVREAKT